MTRSPVPARPDSLRQLEPAPTNPPAPAAEPGTVRELITQLAEVEDAIRTTPIKAEGEAASGPNPDFVALIEREAAIVAALRARRPA